MSDWRKQPEQKHKTFMAKDGNRVKLEKEVRDWIVSQGSKITVLNGVDGTTLDKELFKETGEIRYCPTRTICYCDK